MPTLKSSKQIRNQLEKQWQKFKFQQAYVNELLDQQNNIFPLTVSLSKPTDKQWLHHYDEIKTYLADINQLDNIQGFTVEKQQANYANMGKQIIPITLTIINIEMLARYLGKWQSWQAFVTNTALLYKALPQLSTWLLIHAKEIEKYQTKWSKLISVCQYFIKHPQPKSYIRQLTIKGVDTKFIEQHKSILKSLLDELLPQQYINTAFEKLTEHGFEKRFGLLYEQPQVRFRLLDPQLTHEFLGMNDISLPIEQFQRLDLLIGSSFIDSSFINKVFITENKVNGLAFPKVNNAIVIFGLGYGIQTLKQVNWLNHCQLHYWGDIDTHGFAILSQLRSYFPKVKSLLMDEATLLACKNVWGQEPAHKSHKAELLANLNNMEQTLYNNLKQNTWQPYLRLEQEQIPFALLEQALKLKINTETNTRI
ncbi:MAG: hypothetical protein JJV99_13140 [Colwellia sp.]|nr:hypothetical protein [Colwellia sp.]